jgi:hypothetical protein
MIPQPITVAEIQNGLPEQIRPFLSVEAAPLPQSFRPLVEALWRAAGKIAPTIRLRKRVIIVISGSPWNVDFPNLGRLTLTPLGDTIHLTVEDLIFIDANKMQLYDSSNQEVTILEELVHAFMNVSDEDLVKQIVCHLHKDFEFTGGQYRLRQRRI